MSDDAVTPIVTEFFAGGWRVAPFVKTSDGYIGVKAWPKRAALNQLALTELLAELSAKSTREPILGISPPAGRYVVDIDTKKNASALQLWKDKVFEVTGDHSLGLPQLIVKTKSGGYHLYYSDGSDRMLHSPTSVFSKDSGIDIRGYTGMVIAPTSIGTEMDWVAGEYTIIRGRPTDPPTVLPLAKILGDTFDEVDTFIKGTLSAVNEALRNTNVPDHLRHLLLSDSFVIPSSNRDNTLYRCARLCRLAGLNQDSATLFMSHVAMRCEATAEEPAEHWIRLSGEKVRRVYADDAELKFKSATAFFDELDNAGAVLLTGVSKTYYYFRLGSRVLNIEPRSKFSTENFGNVVQGHDIHTDEGRVPVRKIVPLYRPREVARAEAMYPRVDMPYFDFEGVRYVNTYFDPFASFEPDPGMLQRAAAFVDKFRLLTKHITGHRPGDDEHLLDKLAWIVQKPYRRMPTGTIIYSLTRGTGKDIFMALVREVVGPTYYMPISLKSLTSTHTLMHDKLICTASEVQLQANGRGNMEAAAFMGTVKDLITRKTVYVDEKFVQPYSAPIFANFFILSNFQLSALIEPGDRRWDIFHAAEEKLDQQVFGELADMGSDGVWVERSASEQAFRRHVIYALRRYLSERTIGSVMDREEARTNDVKQEIIDHQNPPAIAWMLENLPSYFTEDMLMAACSFCPFATRVEYILKYLREHLGPELRVLQRGSVNHRMNGAPRYELRSDGSMKVPILNFATDSSYRRIVYYVHSKPRAAYDSDPNLRVAMRRWYEDQVNKLHARNGNPAALPGARPATD